jgi:tetratricopeptide (TPR) repeat protein
MRRHNILLLFASLFLFTIQAQSAVQKISEQQKIYEELTGKKAAPTQGAQQKPVALADSRPVSRKLLDAGFYAFTKKDYISALKYYNTIIVKYPGSSELQLAYLAKSKMYNEMGLIDQAKLNLQYANQVGKKAQTTK